MFSDAPLRRVPGAEEAEKIVRRLRLSLVGLGSALAIFATGLTGCTAAKEDLVSVPEDVATISEAVDRVAEGGLVLVGPGTYPEQVLIEKNDVTVRGRDRNTVVIDGEGMRPYGVVAVADGVSVENLTVTQATLYGVLVTGLHDESGPIARGARGYTTLDVEDFPPVQRFAIDHVTAYNNGLYGLYAFNAQHGTITDSYASGSADSGIYVGQCEKCDILVAGNISEANAVGFENANASDSVTVAGNRFTMNRIGVTLISSYQEALAPQRRNTVIGNLISNNANPDSPSQAEGIYGVGVGVSGGRENLFKWNRISQNPVAGVVLDNTEDFAPLDNRFTENVFDANGVNAAIVAADRAPASGNCFDTPPASVLPDGAFNECEGDPGFGSRQEAVRYAALPAIEVPDGISFLQVPPPPAQPTMKDPMRAARKLPARVPHPPLEQFTTPGQSFLQEWSR
ncbi:MAG: nitrous oxide reductase family maturation protein NosD [Microbacterium sp.]|uniref:right-handed parallel beta-helix repeat-containing protein n=1 Tax=Microbacterium sp. TaxID=51671 RepID=UPI003A842689